jgi:hypothetical protein
MKPPVLAFISALLMITISCRPVMTVGWQEILILFIIVAVFFGPVIFRIYRRWGEFRQWKGKEKDQ